ncbi:hypothetical protein [Biostraticola tofi]|uniref:Uncharacterized protein n=1 Tax=Biostraticola tofi TaxID=466109 RepID=A0A4R3YFS1_9GAMM|nr:hypothetical protein [Biostraticola tofi]TCV91047.1 hypothetical protein EDC52_1245 [Biostraticola tofi]
MINIDFLDEFSREYLIFLEKSVGEKLQSDEIYLAENHSVVDSIQSDIENINLSIALFIKARNNNDELAMRAALLHIRSFMMGVYGVFYQIVEDIDHFIELPDKISFPKDYKIPEHYNYPIK